MNSRGGLALFVAGIAFNHFINLYANPTAFITVSPVWAPSEANLNLVVPVFEFTTKRGEGGAVAWMDGYTYNPATKKIECHIWFGDPTFQDGKPVRAPSVGELIVHEVQHCYGGEHGDATWIKQKPNWDAALAAYGAASK